MKLKRLPLALAMGLHAVFLARIVCGQEVPPQPVADNAPESTQERIFFEIPVVPEAEEAFALAREMEAAGDSLNAYLLFLRAASLDPANPRYSTEREAMRGRMSRAAIISAGPDPAEIQAFRVNVEGVTTTEAIVSEPALPAPRLMPAAEGSIARRSFDLRGTAELIYEEIGAAYGLIFIFGDGYQDPGTFDYRVRNADWKDALRVLELASNSFIVPVGGNAALVFRDQPQTRGEQSPNISVAIPIPERMSVQEAQEIASGAQQTMDLQRIAVDAGRRVIFLRGQEASVLGARKIINDLTRYRAQVALDIELLSAGSSSMLKYGLDSPTTIPLVSFSTFLNNMPQSMLNLATFGGGQTLIGIGIADAMAVATLTRTSATSAMQSRMVSLDGQEMTFRLGDRVPVITGLFTDPNGNVAATPQTQFLDIGLELDITPAVHSGGEITLTIAANFSQLTGQQRNGIPVIANRELSGTVRLKDGEWAVIAGLTASSKSETVNGWPLVSRIPWAGQLFSQKTVIEDQNEVLIVIKPHLMTIPAWESPTKEMYVGTETTPASLF